MSSPSPPRSHVLLAYAAVYIIWGSTYFFIREALDGFPPFLLGALRFIIASALMFGWCIITGQRIRPGADLKSAALVGFMLLFIGNGAVVWVEQAVPSSVVAIMIAAAPIWFVLLDHPNFSANLRSRSTVFGIVVGFGGVLLLFSDSIIEQFRSPGRSPAMDALVILTFSTMAWAFGSLHAKRNPSSIPPAVNTAWQMLVAGISFSLVSISRGEWHMVDVAQVPLHAWFATAYLAVFGSIIAFSAYVWLLKVRPATQVSTYAYVNPVVAVLLGAFVGKEHITWNEVAGLVVILGSVLSINIAKYRKRAQ